MNQTGAIFGPTPGIARNMSVSGSGMEPVMVPTLPGSGPLSAWTPAQLPGLIAWYDAQNAASITLNGSNVSQWNDLSGNAHNMTQGTAANQPPYNAMGLNGKPTIDVNYTTASANQFLSTSLAAGVFTAGAALMFVFQYRTGFSGEIPFSRVSSSNFANPFDRDDVYVVTGNGSANSAITSSEPPVGNYSSPTILGCIWTPSTNIYAEWVNGSSAFTWNPASMSPWGDTQTTLNMGMRQGGGTYCLAYVSEAIACPTITTSDRQKLEGYLAWKWGLETNLPAGHPYKAGPPQNPITLPQMSPPVSGLGGGDLNGTASTVIMYGQTGTACGRVSLPRAGLGITGIV